MSGAPKRMSYAPGPGVPCVFWEPSPFAAYCWPPAMRVPANVLPRCSALTGTCMVSHRVTAWMNVSEWHSFINLKCVSKLSQYTGVSYHCRNVVLPRSWECGSLLILQDSKIGANLIHTYKHTHTHKLHAHQYKVYDVTCRFA
jgi:hypothetical protein